MSQDVPICASCIGWDIGLIENGSHLDKVIPSYTGVSEGRENMSKTEMRVAIEDLGKLGEFTASDVQLRVKATPHGVKIYLSALVNSETLNIAKNVYRRGPEFNRWCNKKPKTNPGGGSVEYKTARDKRDLENVSRFRAQLIMNRNKVTETNPMVPAKHWDKRFTAAFRKG